MEEDTRRAEKEFFAIHGRKPNSIELQDIKSIRKSPPNITAGTPLGGMQFEAEMDEENSPESMNNNGEVNSEPASSMTHEGEDAV